MEIAPRISVDERVRFGRPVITGTRVPVDLVLGKLAGGLTFGEMAVLLTGDLAFSNILKFPLGEHFGIVVARCEERVL